MLPMRRAFDLMPGQQEVVVSSTVFAAFVSSLCGGSLNQKFGRRISILIAAAVFTVGSLLLLVAWDYLALIVSRVILRVGIGIASLTTPVYIAEVALPRMRGYPWTIRCRHRGWRLFSVLSRKWVAARAGVGGRPECRHVCGISPLARISAVAGQQGAPERIGARLVGVAGNRRGSP